MLSLGLLELLLGAGELGLDLVTLLVCGLDVGCQGAGLLLVLLDGSLERLEGLLSIGSFGLGGLEVLGSSLRCGGSLVQLGLKCGEFGFLRLGGLDGRLKLSDLSIVSLNLLLELALLGSRLLSRCLEVSEFGFD